MRATDEAGPHGRLVVLDSLRGLAALTVVFSHALNVFPQLNDGAPKGVVENVLVHTPLHIIWAGTEAVALFFVLSGFVLSLPFHGARHGTYGDYLIRRICRIYLPYLAAVVFALSVRVLLAGRDVTALGGLVKKMWSEPFRAFDAFTHATLVVLIPDGEQSNPVIWSLTHEMRISLVFPLIMWTVLRFRWYVPVVASLTLAVVSDFAGRAVSAEANVRTGAYVVLFVVGALLAKHRHVAAGWVASRRRVTHAVLFAVAVLSYTFAFWAAPSLVRLHEPLIDLAFITAGAALFILLALSVPSFQRMLLTPPVVFLGRISYSLYLVHVVVIMSAVRLLYGTMPLPVILVLAVCVSVALAAAAYRIVESPAIDLGKALVAKRRAQRLAGAETVSSRA